MRTQRLFSLLCKARAQKIRVILNISELRFRVSRVAPGDLLTQACLLKVFQLSGQLCNFAAMADYQIVFAGDDEDGGEESSGSSSLVPVSSAGKKRKREPKKSARGKTAKKVSSSAGRVGKGTTMKFKNWGATPAPNLDFLLNVVHPGNNNKCALHSPLCVASPSLKYCALAR